MINPRGSTGYGQKFLEEVTGDWGGRPYQDLMKGLDYAEAKYPFIDKTRECALGASYGGYMANWVLTHTNRFKCIVTHDGMYNPQPPAAQPKRCGSTSGSSAPPQTIPGLGRPSADAKQTAAGHPAEPWRYQNLPPTRTPSASGRPCVSIQNAKTPTLIVHSPARLCGWTSPRACSSSPRCSASAFPRKMLYFPDEGHWVLKPQNSQLWNQTVSDWCDRWLGMNKYAEKGPERNPAAAK